MGKSCLITRDGVFIRIVTSSSLPSCDSELACVCVRHQLALRSAFPFCLNSAVPNEEWNRSFEITKIRLGEVLDDLPQFSSE